MMFCPEFFLVQVRYFSLDVQCAHLGLGTGEHRPIVALFAISVKL